MSAAKWGHSVGDTFAKRWEEEATKRRRILSRTDCSIIQSRGQYLRYTGNDKRRGDKSQLMAAIIDCARKGSPLPTWVARGANRRTNPCMAR
jgi:hypothetical protein